MLAPLILMLLLAANGVCAAVGGNSILYVMGCAKDVAQFLPKVKRNVYGITKLFTTYRVVIYSDSLSYSAFEDWRKKDDKVEIVRENFNHPSRTTRLAFGRNALLANIHSQAKANKEQTLENSYLLVLDFDDINTRPLNMTAVETVLTDPKVANEWDAVSFNRGYYYDIWALRYSRFNVNVWNFGAQSSMMRDIIEADLISLLNPNEAQLFPVESAFNGIAFYRLKSTLNCAYNGTNSEVFSAFTLYNHTRATIPEECEHVAFHRCITHQNKGRVRIYSGPIA